MKVSRVFTVFVVLAFAAVSAAAAQGRGAGQRPAKVPVQAAKGAPQGPKAGGPANRAERPKPARASARAEKPDTIAANIARSPQLEARLKAMLPSGMTLEQASDGFRNQGQFIAALEASKSQNIPFAQLKAEMTGDDALSLGQAIQKLKPSTSAP